MPTTGGREMRRNSSYPQVGLSLLPGVGGSREERGGTLMSLAWSLTGMWQSVHWGAGRGPRRECPKEKMPANGRVRRTSPGKESRVGTGNTG